MSQRNLVATLLRGNKPVWSRRYARLDTAIPRCTQLALLEGHPRDVIELSHAETGMQIGTVKLGVGNRIVSTWAWD